MIDESQLMEVVIMDEIGVFCINVQCSYNQMSWFLNAKMWHLTKQTFKFNPDNGLIKVVVLG